MTQRWQYQIRAEPLSSAAPDFGWFVQASEPTFVPPQHPEQALAQPVSEHASVIPDYDWFVAPPDVILPLHQTRPGMPVLGEPPTIPDFDWLVQEPEQVFQAPHQTRPGIFVQGQPPIIPDFDWFLQQADVTRPPHQVRPGASVLVEFSVPVILDIDWIVQEVPIFRAPHQTRPGLAALGQPPTIPNYDWFLQQADVTHPPHQTQPGYFALVEFSVPVILDIDWLIQETPVFRAPHQVRPGLFVIGRPPTIPDLAWYNQYPEQFLPAKFRPYYYPAQEFRTELPFPVTFDQWWQPASEPVRLIPIVNSGVIVVPTELITYSQSGWPFLALINPADHPTGTQFFFEVKLATDNGAITAFAQLYNLTDAGVVAGSTLSTAVTGLGDRLRSGAITLAAGDKEYIPQRGDADDTSHARLYEARLVIVTPA